MKAMVLEGVKQLKLRQLPDPKPGANEVVIKVAYCGVCMTDVHMYTGSFPVKTPIVLGHECSGIVSEVGSEVSKVSVGDHVALNPLINCGQCWYCISGRTNLCENSLVIGGAGEVIINGAYAEYVKVPERNVVKYDEGISLKHAALTEPLACAVHGIELAKVRPGDRVVIIGAGPIGLMLTQLSVINGSSQVIVLDLKDERLKVAKQVGASEVVNPRERDPVEAIKEATGGEFADIVIEAVGSTTTVQDTFKYVRKGGRIVIFGVSPRKALASFSPFDVYFRELEIIGSYAVSAESFIRSAALISRAKIDLNALITDIYRLEDLEEAIMKTERGEGLKKLISVAGG